MNFNPYNVEPEWTRGAVDLSKCRYAICRCGRCQKCGHPMHAAVHGPGWGKPPGSEPWDHEYVPQKSPAAAMAEKAGQVK